VKRVPYRRNEKVTLPKGSPELETSEGEGVTFMQTIRKHAARRPLRPFRTLALVPACLALGACSSDELSLGEGDQPLEAGGSDCAYSEDGIVVGDVTARSQEEIDALAGCEQVLGNLSVSSGSSFNLRALAALRVVGGGLTIGSGTEQEEYTDDNDDGFDDAVGEVSSLEGLEALEEVRSLAIERLQSADLLPLSRLRSFRAGQSARRGEIRDGGIYIAGCPNLVNLSGLEGLHGWRQITLDRNAALASLDGIGTPDDEVTHVAIYDAPALRDLSALAPVLAIEELTLLNTGLESLDGLNLEEILSLYVADNPNLVEMDALVNVHWTREWQIARNPMLDHLPELASLDGLQMLQVTENDELRSIPLYDTPGATLGFSLGGRQGNPYEQTTRPDNFRLLEIAHNPKLTQFSLPSGLARGNHVDIYANISLTELDLEDLTNVDGLSIRDNPVLASVDIDDLETVDNLAIENNPALSVAEFAEVKTFTRTLDGNADTP
jgi:hypothetical protein